MRVLVVEDDERTARILQRGLAEDGYSVDVAHDGTDGLWHATEIDYDVVVLDVMLPGINGLEVCRKMRAAERWAPVLMLTARTGFDDRVQGLDCGADDYLAKPFDFRELSARLRALVRRGGPARPAVLSAGDLCLDPTTHNAWRGDVPLSLSVKEFALLEFFLRRAGQVLSRAVIREHVWDFASDTVSNIVDQHVASLRRKTDRPFGVEQIETVRGAGYRLREHPTPLADAQTSGAGPPRDH